MRKEQEESYTWDDLAMGFYELMHDLYGDVEICGMTYSAVDVWKEHDPIAYRCALSDYVANNFHEDEQDSDVYYAL